MVKRHCVAAAEIIKLCKVQSKSLLTGFLSMARLEVQWPRKAFL
jgi:hypothetical protein